MTKEGMIIINILTGDDYSESESFATDIFTAIDGSEKRTKKTNTPKRTIAYSAYAVDEQKADALEEILTYALKYNCLHPLWFSETKATNTDNTNIITCDTTKSDFKIGDYALIRKDFFTFYAEKITAVTNNSITLENAVSLEAGINILPLIRCTPDKSIAYNFLHRDYATWQLEFKELL